MGPHGAGLIANGPISASLEHLCICRSNGDVGASGVKALATGRLSKLKHLDLHRSGVGDAGAMEIVKGNISASLEYLDIRPRPNFWRHYSTALANDTRQALLALPKIKELFVVDNDRRKVDECNLEKSVVGMEIELDQWRLGNFPTA